MCTHHKHQGPVELQSGEPSLEHPVSQLCTQSQVDSRAYKYWCAAMGEEPRYHRKQWEFCYILQALGEAGMLDSGFRGLGFAVGREPLSSMFASRGCEILATDAPANADVGGAWSASDQHASNAAHLNERGLCAQSEFDRRVRFEAVDMNRIPEHCNGFDFLWSACAFEHLGSLEKGAEFLERSLKCLRPGGIAVHTTEYNVSSENETLASGSTVLYRRGDILEIAQKLWAQGHHIVLNLNPGGGNADSQIDGPPYQGVHLKLWTAGFVATSLV